MNTLYAVTYWFFCDPDKAITEIFETQEEATKFEEVIWAKCQEAHIEVEVILYMTKVKRYNDALDSLNEIIKFEKEWLTEDDDD